ncbi:MULTISPECIES: glutamyl-tRNA reductase [Hymenobacter]|uniref:Glutamyl-tRNA reductase n=2 Tax=Hymenobacter TaxID=89966 RepID=A0ABS6WX30_9BACT|nr:MULTISPECIES: glutamyl-tRNA reductase [Hymenobacter]MBO3272565.1 glutamyl-tRNA reductase [Hymenobacter defluvii]MBW3128140.1 glutamyl-tRNA reductase [Hymenobacter profundi]
MLHPFKAVSLSYKKAPLEIRELIALDEAACRRFLHMLHHDLHLQDLLVLSTCNRTEVYYAADRDQSPAIIEALTQLKQLPDAAAYYPYFDILDTYEDAVQHLFEVSMGLDAQVVGDLQISNQVKMAYQYSADADAAGPFLHRLLHTIFFTNKRVQQETAFRDGAASTSYAALELVEELTADVANPRVLVVGLGEIGADVCRHLGDSRQFSDVTICNRTRHKAEQLAAECGVKVVDFENLTQSLREADVVISSIARDTPFFTRELVAHLDVLSYKFFIDLSVPRSIEAEVETVPGVLVYNIDAIHSKTSAALERRLAAVPQVRAIIAESIAGLGDWAKEMMVSPIIQKIKGALETLRQEELERHLKKTSPEEAKRLEDVTRSLMNKVLKQHVLQLKAACKRDNADQLVDALTELFDLENQPTTA